MTDALRLDSVVVDIAGRRVLDHVSLALPPGAVSACIGVNGCGKTTLARLACGYLYPTSGTVDILGQRLGQTDLHALRGRVALAQRGERPARDEDMTTRQVILSGCFGTIGLYRTPTPAQTARAADLAARVSLTGQADQPRRSKERSSGSTCPLR